MNKVCLWIDKEKIDLIFDESYKLDFINMETGNIIHVEHIKDKKSIISSLPELKELNGIEIYVNNQQLLSNNTSAIIPTVSNFKVGNIVYDLLEIFISR